MASTPRRTGGRALLSGHWATGNFVAGVKERVDEVAGGPARRHVILLLAAILGLDTADKAALSSVAGGLKAAFGVGNTDVGILLSVVSVVGAVLTLPMGALVDRFRRTRMLWIAIVLWSIGMLVSGLATSYVFLLGARVFLGVVTALAGPAVASLVGDFFPGRDRGRVYGMVLAGELIGLGAGFLVSGLLSSWLDWRWAFWGLVPMSAVIAILVRAFLPEPARGGQSWLRVGAEHARSREDVAAGRFPEETADQADAGETGDSGTRQDMGRRAAGEGARPRRELVMHEDPQRRSLWWAARYVLSVPTVRRLIVGSTLVYFYFAGLRSFVVVYYTAHLGISRAAVTSFALLVGIATVGAVVLGGRFSDRLIDRGRLTARLVVPSAVLVLTVAVAIPAIILTSLWAVVPLLCVAGALMAAANPPIDAARLDVIPAGLWGRAEAVRQCLRGLGEAAAPVTFGVVSQYVFGAGSGGVSLGAGATHSGQDTRGLEYTFLLMSLTLLVGAVVVFFARRPYARDVVTAAAATDRVRSAAD